MDWTTPRNGIPNFSKPINYWGEIPEFKHYEKDFLIKVFKRESV